MILYSWRNEFSFRKTAMAFVYIVLLVVNSFGHFVAAVKLAVGRLIFLFP
jgi:hypothetical protein